MKPGLTHHLSRRDLAELLNLSFQSIQCRNHDDLETLVRGLKRLFHFDYAVCARGNALELIAGEQQPHLDIFDISYPRGYLDLYLKNKCYANDAIFNEFATNLSPVNWAAVDKRCGYKYLKSIHAPDFNMKDGWTHGMLRPQTMNCTVFFFAGPSVDRDPRSAQILDYIIPFYCDAYRRAMGKPVESFSDLTTREVEVLKWVKEGKSSWETSVILGCSKRNVDVHVNNIKHKLNATSRAQIVAIALQNGIIHF